MPLITDERWTFVCGVCAYRRATRPGSYPTDWRRLNIRPQVPHGLEHLELWRATRFEDWVCSEGCAVAVVARSWDAPVIRRLRDAELATIAARDARTVA